MTFQLWKSSSIYMSTGQWTWDPELRGHLLGWLLLSTSHGEDKKCLLDEENCIQLKLPSYSHFSIQNHEVQVEEKQFACMLTHNRGAIDREHFCNLRSCLLRISNASK